MRFFGIILGTFLLGTILGISLMDVNAQCHNEFCASSITIAEKLYENEEPYEIRHLQLFKHDKRGNQIERIHFDKNANISLWEKKVYDDRNNLSEIKQYYRYKENISHEKFNYIFHNNLVVRISMNSNDEVSGRTIYLTNDDGKVMKYQRVDSRGNPIQTNIWKDNQKGQEIEYREFLTKPGIWVKTEYDENNRMISSTTLYPNGKIERQLTFEYEDDKKISEKIFIGGSYLKSEEKYEYDDNGNLVKMRTFDGHGNVKQLQLSIYDKNNNQIEERIIEYKRNMLIGTMMKSYKMNYDDNGNMLDQKTFMKNGNLKDWKRYNYDDNGKLSQVIVFDVPPPYLQK